MIGVFSFGALAVGIVLRLFDLISAETFDVIFAIAMGNTAMALAMKAGTLRGYATLIGFTIPVLTLGVQWFLSADPPVALSGNRHN